MGLLVNVNWWVSRVDDVWGSGFRLNWWGSVSAASTTFTFASAESSSLSFTASEKSFSS